MPGLVIGASEGKGSGNQFLSNIRQVDCLVHIVRAFSDENVLHPEGTINVIRDIENIGTELLLADLQLVETRIERINTGKKSPKNKWQREKFCKNFGNPWKMKLDRAKLSYRRKKGRFSNTLTFYG